MAGHWRLTTTGHAARGTGGPPTPSPSNLAMMPGKLTPEQLIGEIENGFYVTEMMGSGLNGVTGDYSRGAAGFRDRDLYVFCARVDGRVDAHIDPAQIGRNIKDQYDIDGVAFGQEIMAVAKAGAVTAISYMWPTPGTLAPVQKVTFVTRVAENYGAQ